MLTFAKRAATGSLTPAHYVFAAVLVLRLITLARLTGSPALLPAGGDTHFYDLWAQRIAAGQWTDGHAFYGLPLYAYWLAFIYRAFGYGPFIPGLIQSAVDAGTAALLYQLGCRAFGDGFHKRSAVGLLAAAGWALFVPAQTYSVILMPTALVVFVVWFLVWLLADSDVPPTPLRILVYGFLIGFTAMAAATALFLVPLVVIAAWLRSRAADANPLRLTAIALVSLIAGVILGTAPCWVHNVFVARDRVFLSAHSGVNFWIGNNPSATGYPHFTEGLSAGQAGMLKDSISLAEQAAGRTLRMSEVSRYWNEKAAGYIRDNPGSWTRLMLRKFVNVWSAFEYDDLSIVNRFREERLVLPGFGFGVIAALALAGACVSLSRLKKCRWVLGAIALHLASILPVFVTERYRLAMVPGLLLFASYGVVFLWRCCANRRARPAIGYVLLLLGATAFVSIPPASVSVWALPLYSAGGRSAERGQSEQAEEEFRRALLYAPGNAEVLFALGNVYYERSDYPRARQFYDKVLRDSPRHRGALNNVGVIDLQAGEFIAAERSFRLSLEQENGDAKVHYLRARALAGLGDRATAGEEIAEALHIDPKQPEFLAFQQQVGAQ